MRCWPILAGSVLTTLVAIACSGSDQSAPALIATPGAEPRATVAGLAIEVLSISAARLSSEEVESAVRGFQAETRYCDLAGSLAGTCTVGLSALIRCNESLYWRRYTFPAPDSTPTVFRISWDPAEGRWLIEVTCGNPHPEQAEAARFWYYERKTLVPLDDPARLLFPKAPGVTPP